MQTTEDALAAFLKREAGAAPYPGSCCRMADNWVCESLGFSPLSKFGRALKSEEDVKEWLGEWGGMAVAVNRVMRFSGFQKTSSPKVGDVGLVLTGETLAMGVLSKDGWVSRGDKGLCLSQNFWKAWSVV